MTFGDRTSVKILGWAFVLQANLLGTPASAQPSPTGPEFAANALTIGGQISPALECDA